MSEVQAPTEAEKYLEDLLSRANQRIEGLEEIIAKKDKLSQLRAWGIDRAVSIYQLKKDHAEIPSYEEITLLADKLANYAFGEDDVKELVQ